MDALDIELNKALVLLHLIERAIHDQAIWIARHGTESAVITRVVNDASVTLVASFENHGHQVEGYGDPCVEIIASGEVIARVPVESQGESGFLFTWDLALSTVATVS